MMPARTRLLVAVGMGYVMLVPGWLGPWLRTWAWLELYALVLLGALHLCFIALLLALHTSLIAPSASVQSPLAPCPLCHVSASRRFTHSRLLDCCVTEANWRSYGIALLLGLVCAWTSSLGAILRLTEMAGIVHLGSVEPGSELSVFGATSLILAEVAAAVTLPMFAISLSAVVQW